MSNKAKVNIVAAVVYVALVSAAGWCGWNAYRAWQRVHAKDPAPHVQTAGQPAPEVDTHYDKDDLQVATLQRIKARLDEVDSGSTVEAIKQARIKLDCLAAWVEKQPPGQVTQSYRGWVEWFSNNYDRWEKEAEKSKSGKSESERRWEETEKQMDRAKAMNIPKPPRAICQGTETEFKGKIGGEK